MGSRKKIYITTAIDYVNNLPHIGHAYEKIGADVLARWYRLNGYDVHFQIGSDEHSINVKKAADEAGRNPKEYCDGMRKKFERTWRRLGVSYDGFIQTTDPHHERGVQALFKKIMESGDIYRAHYKGWYCESCEAYLTDKDLADGLCPSHKSRPKWLSEENYFFALSKYRDRLLKHIKNNPEFVLPDVRRNEILSLLMEGLQDISISRSSAEWGVPLPDDPSQVVYVWVDALTNYITAVGFGWDEERFKKWWPADVHVIGKDIIRFHCVIWPAMLMSAGIGLPKTIFAHGFVSLKGEKMSKTLGNIVSPMDVIDRVGGDPLRYYLMREGAFGRDRDFTWEHFIERYNGDLANGIGNLVSRTIGMAARYQKGAIRPVKEFDSKCELAKATDALPKTVSEMLDHSTGEVEFHRALASIWETIAAADRHINEHRPWEMAKEGKSEDINRVLWETASCLRVVAILLSPFIPETAARIWHAMGLSALGELSKQSFDDARKRWGALKSAIETKPGESLFPRIEAKPEGEKKAHVRGAPSPSHQGNNSSGTNISSKEEKMEPSERIKDVIDMTDFTKIDLRIAQITSAEPVEGADKLLKLVVDMGGESRQLVAGIAKHYEPSELVGKKIAVVANLKPARLMGVESQGMLLAASDDKTISILTPLRDVATGSKIK